MLQFALQKPTNSSTNDKRWFIQDVYEQNVFYSQPQIINYDYFNHVTYVLWYHHTSRLYQQVYWTISMTNLIICHHVSADI